MRISSINSAVNFNSRRNYTRPTQVSDTVKHEDSKGPKDTIEYLSQGYRRLNYLNAYGNRPIDAFNESIHESPCEADEDMFEEADPRDFRDDLY